MLNARSFDRDRRALAPDPNYDACAPAAAMLEPGASAPLRLPAGNSIAGRMEQHCDPAGVQNAGAI